MQTNTVPIGSTDEYFYNASGLTTGIEYGFEVTAWNSTGESAPSDCVVQTTAQVPAAPAGLTVTSQTGTSISVSWNNPGGGGLVSNTLYFAVGTNCSGVMSHDPIYGARQATTLTGLTAGQEYALAVTAWNVTGQSPKSNCLTTTTTAPPSGSSGSLSGTTLEISIAGVVVAAILIAVAVLVLRRRRKGGPTEPPTTLYEGDGPET